MLIYRYFVKIEEACRNVHVNVGIQKKVFNLFFPNENKLEWKSKIGVNYFGETKSALCEQDIWHDKLHRSYNRFLNFHGVFLFSF